MKDGKPYQAVQTDMGPLGPVWKVEGPGGYRTTHGGGKDNGRLRAMTEAAMLNAAYEQGYKDARAAKRTVEPEGKLMGKGGA